MTENLEEHLRSIEPRIRPSFVLGYCSAIKDLVNDLKKNEEPLGTTIKRSLTTAEYLLSFVQSLDKRIIDGTAYQNQTEEKGTQASL